MLRALHRLTPKSKIFHLLEASGISVGQQTPSHGTSGRIADQRGQHPSGSRPPKKYIGYSATKINFSLEPPRPLCYTCTR